MQYGLTLDKSGVFRMNGKPFWGYGVNAYTMIYNRQLNPRDESYKDGFEMLQKYTIPFIRTPVTYEPVSYYELYQRDKDAFFEGADRILDEALRKHIGVIVILVNSARYTSMLGEKPCAVGDMNSRSMAYQVEQAATFVQRYKDHPAVWGWEIRNEANLEANLFRHEYGSYQADVYGVQVGEFNGRDSVTSEEHAVFSREIAKVVRQYDPYRFISSGDALMRESAWHLHQAAMKMDENHVWTEDWTRDTLEEWRRMILYSTPDPINAVCQHMGMPAPDFSYQLADVALDYPALIREYVDVAKSANKGFYYGEFGDVGTDEDAVSAGLRLRDNMRIMIESGVQLGTLWQFNGANNIFNDEGKMGSMFREITKVNEAFRQEGLQDVRGVWD